jgi:hypothetical protein
VFRYRAYGLSVRADQPLFELQPVSAADSPRECVRLRLRARAAHIPEPREWIIRSAYFDGSPWLRCARIERGYLLRYAGLAEFIVDREGLTVVCSRRNRRVTPYTVRHLVLDHVFPFLLNLRGRAAIHATAIQCSRGVCAFTGPGGAGKSTLAASFARAGYPSLGDDCLALDVDGQVMAVPAYPGHRLWTDTVHALAADQEKPVWVAHYSYKRRVLHPVETSTFPDRPSPLIRIYRITRPVAGEEPVSAPAIEPLSPREAFLELVSSTFPVDVTEPEMLERHFRFVSRVTELVPIRRLRVPNDFALLPAVREAVLADLDN